MWDCECVKQMRLRLFLVCFFFFKQKTAYEMRISDWSSDVCSSDLHDGWHVLQSDGGEWPFYVYQRDALPALRTWRDRSATLRLATFPATSQDRKSVV